MWPHWGLLILPNRIGNKAISPEKLLVAIDDPARFLSTDKVTERIVAGDPSLQLIDVRTAEQFRKYALQGAVNVPLDSLLNPQWKEILQQAGKDKVFYSNADIEADQAWQICRRNSVDRIFVMKGGLNYWMETIMNSIEPPATAPSQAFNLFHFRQAARQFFTGGSVKSESVTKLSKDSKEPEKVNVVRKTPKAAGGGC